jgi:hypothetical protein
MHPGVLMNLTASLVCLQAAFVVEVIKMIGVLHKQIVEISGVVFLLHERCGLNSFSEIRRLSKLFVTLIGYLD